jgi:hypothetical protein
MQETHFSQNIENNLIQDFKGSLYQSNGISNSTYAILIDKYIYLFEKSVSFVHIIGSINVYYSVNSIVYFDIYK